MNRRVGSFIASLRKEKQMTQEQLAEKLGVSNRSVSRWENGYTMPDLSLMQCICEVFHITLTELLNGEKQILETENREYLEKNIALIIDLLQNEKKKKSKVLNFCFGLGVAFLGIVFYQSFLLSLEIIKDDSLTVIRLVVFGLIGIGFWIAGFYYNNKKDELSEKEIAVFVHNKEDICMKSAEEMFQYAKKNQKHFLKQHRRAFEEVCKELLEKEYILFTMFADEYMINGQPGPWHVGVAVSNERLFVCGETISGRMFVRYVMDVFKHSEINFIRLEKGNMVIETSRGKLVLKGENMEGIEPEVKKILAER